MRTTAKIVDIDKIAGLKSEASEIDNTISISNFGANIILQSKLQEARRIDIYGDSITAGTGVSSLDDLWSESIKNLLLEKKGSNSLGFVSASNYNSFEYNHKIILSDDANWNLNLLNSKSIDGSAQECSIADSYISFYIVGKIDSTAKVVFVKPIVDSEYLVYLNDSLIETITIIADSQETIEYSQPILLNGESNTIKVVLKSGSISISGVHYIDNISTSEVNRYAVGGRRIRYITADVLINYKNADAMIFALGYNDVVGGSTDEIKIEVENILNELAIECINNNKLFVYINTIWDVSDTENWVLSKLLEVFGTYEYFYNIDYRSTILDGNLIIATDDYRQNILQQWSDGAHPNSNGSRRLYNYLAKKFFNESSYEKIKPQLLKNENYSFIYRDKNDVGILVKSSTIMGVNNTVKDNSSYGTCFGINNIIDSDYYNIIGGNNTTDKNSISIIGSNCIAGREYSTIQGNYGHSLNSCDLFAQSKEGKIHQVYKHLRSVKTTTSAETYLRESSGSALVQTHNDTAMSIKGNIFAVNLDGTTCDEWEVNAKIINIEGSANSKSDDGYTLDGVTRTKGSSNISCRIVTINNNTFTVRVTGLDGVTLGWSCNLNIHEISLDY